MGLSEAALQQIAGIASNGLDENATAEAIEERAKQYEPIMKAMQSEATRWAQRKQELTPPVVPPVTKPNEDAPWQAAIKELESKYATAQQQQADLITKLQAQLAESERKGVVATAMRKFGLTEADMEFVTVPTDANVDEYLGKYKQSLVNRGLKPADQNVTKEAKDKAEAELAKNMLEQYAVKTD